MEKLGCFPNRQNPVELSRENGKTLFDWNKVSNGIKAIHRNLNTVWQSRTGNKNFWKCNGQFRSNWTGRSKRTRRRFRSVPLKRSIYFSTEIYHHFGTMESTLGPRSRSYNLWWPTTVTAKPKTSRQKQKHHGKTKNLTAKTKYLTAKPNTSQQRQNSFGFAEGICFSLEIFGFCCEVFGFAVRSLVLPWGFWFCREVFCFCREVFGFAVTVVGHRNNRRHYRWDVDPLENGKSPGTRLLFQ